MDNNHSSGQIITPEGLERISGKGYFPTIRNDEDVSGELFRDDKGFYLRLNDGKLRYIESGDLISYLNRESGCLTTRTVELNPIRRETYHLTLIPKGKTPPRGEVEKDAMKIKELLSRLPVKTAKRVKEILEDSDF